MEPPYQTLTLTLASPTQVFYQFRAILMRHASYSSGAEISFRFYYIPTAC